VEDIRRISLQEVRSRGWVIIFGKVYNLSDYVERHPGGADLLLGVAGRDATVEFETMRHSSAALVQMEKLFVGICDPAKSSESSEPAKPLQLTGGRQSSRLKINQVDSWWNVEECGFLPCADPVKELPAPWDRLVKLSEVLPSLTVHGKFRTAAERELCHALPQNRTDIKEALDVLSEGEAESLHSLLGYICLAYLHGPPDVYEKGQTVKLDILGRRPDLDHLPAWLSMPWICVSERLERRPMLDYAGCVLNNWERLDPAGPIKPSNLRLLRRFTGLVDEEWFFKTHIIIESEGGHVISSLEAISCAMKDENIHNLLQELHTLEEALWRLASVCLPIMFTRSPSDHSLMCEPFLFFFRLRPYIKSVNVTMDVDDGKEEFTLNGPSGAMSTILPAVDALLGIKNTSAELREAVKAFEAYVPKEHRQFLDRLRNAPQSVKRFVESRKNTVEEKTWYALAGAFNACISRVLDFRWRHWSFVEQFIVRPSAAGFSSSAGSVCPVIHVEGGSPSGPQQPVVGTGGTTFDYLQQHITDSQMARIPLWSKHDILQRTPELQAVQAHVDKERKDLASIPPLNEVDGLWDAAGPNGFVTHRLGALNGWCSGFKAPHPGCQALAHLAASIPTYCFSCHEEAGEQSFIHPFVARCDARQEDLESLVAPSATGPPAESLSIADLEHAWLLLCHVACAYRSMKAHSDPKVVVDPAASMSGPPRPAAIAKELENDWLENVAKQFAEIIDRPFHGVPEYAELVLNNWYVPGYPSNGKEGEAFVISRENIHLVQPACRFLALPDEEWYRKLHLVLEAEGGRAIAAAHQSIRSAMKQRNNREIVGSLFQLASDIDCLSEFQRNQFDNKDSRGEAIMMQRLRPFVSPNLADTEYAVWIYTEGSSPLLPALHAILGLRKLDGISGPLQEHWQQQGRVCMPANHRDFLDSLENEQSVRAYCLREWRHESVEGIAALEDAFNNCIEALLRYCSLRQRLVLRMFPGVAKIKNLSAEQEQVIRTGRVSLLQMRRVADAQRMHLSTKALSGLLPNVGGPPKFETCGY